MTQNPRTPMQQKTDEERNRIESILAGAPAFWTIVVVLGAVFVGALAVPFL